MKEDMGGSGPSEFFSTHPSPDNRIKKLKEWIPIVSKHIRYRINLDACSKN